MNTNLAIFELDVSTLRVAERVALSVFRTQPPSGVRGVAGRAEEAESLILARYPAYAWCAETGGDGVRARAVERARDEGLRGGNVLRLRILNGGHLTKTHRHAAASSARASCFFSSCGGENCSPLVGFTSSSVTRWTVVVLVVDHQ